MMERRRGPGVHILMGVLDGAAHLPAQLGSIAAQSGVDWHLSISDDGSTDGSALLIDRFAACHPGRIERCSGPRKGASANFLSLLAASRGGYVALADQDDIWLRGKLTRAVRMLGDVPADIPALYCARRWIWHAEHGRRAPEALDPRRPTFRNALIENIAAGNTIMLNPAAARLARSVAHLAEGVAAHDWWLYLLISGAGGRVIGDQARVVLYRQHAGNLIGAGHGLWPQILRKRAVLRGAFRARIAGNLTALDRCREHLTPEARAQLCAFQAAHAAALPQRLWHLSRVRPYRQHVTGSMGFWGAAVLGRV